MKRPHGSPLIYKQVEEIDHKATGEAMRQLRKSHNISLREIARRMKLSAPFVSDLERGNRNWDSARALAFMQHVTAAQVARITEAQKNAHKVNFRIGKSAPSEAQKSGTAGEGAR